MIDRNPELPVVHQCSLFGLARSTAYYTPREVPAEDLALMRRIDEWPLDHPFAGTRLLRDLLRPEGFQAGRKPIGTLMARMGIEALYPGRTPLMKAGFLSKQTGPSLTTYQVSAPWKNLGRGSALTARLNRRRRPRLNQDSALR